MKSCRGSRGTAPLILNLNINMEIIPVRSEQAKLLDQKYTAGRAQSVQSLG
jgi:hypothetical protein